MSESTEAPVAEAPSTPVEAAPSQPQALGSDPAPAPVPSFNIDVAAWEAAAAGKEGYDAKAGVELLNRAKGDTFQLVKNAVEAEKAFSSRMPIPDPSNPEKMAEVMEKLGVPKDPSGYQYGESIQFKSDEAKAEMSSWFKEAGVNNEGANSLITKYQAMESAREEANIQSINDGIVQTELFIQTQSGALKGTQAYSDYENTVKATLAQKGIDISDPANSELLGSDVGRKIVAFAYEYGISGRGGKIPGMETVATVADIDTRYAALSKEMMANPSKWRSDPSKQAELDGLLAQKKRIVK